MFSAAKNILLWIPLCKQIQYLIFSTFFFTFATSYYSRNFSESTSRKSVCGYVIHACAVLGETRIIFVSALVNSFECHALICTSSSCQQPLSGHVDRCDPCAFLTHDGRGISWCQWQPKRTLSSLIFASFSPLRY